VTLLELPGKYSIPGPDGDRICRINRIDMINPANPENLVNPNVF
jgi:hypothetical protein